MTLATRNGITLDQWREKYDAPRQNRRKTDSDFIKAARAMEAWSPAYAEVYTRLIRNQMEKYSRIEDRR